MRVCCKHVIHSVLVWMMHIQTDTVSEAVFMWTALPRGFISVSNLTLQVFTSAPSKWAYLMQVWRSPVRILSDMKWCIQRAVLEFFFLHMNVICIAVGSTSGSAVVDSHTNYQPQLHFKHCLCESLKCLQMEYIHSPCSKKIVANNTWKTHIKQGRLEARQGRR